MIRWSYGYRYLLAPEEGYKPDIESQHSSRISPRRSLTMESDENTPLIPSHERESTGDTNGHSRRTSHSDFHSASERGYSTAGTSPIIPSAPLLSHYHDDNGDNDEDITSFPPPRVSRSSAFHVRIQHFLRVAWREFLDFMNMPLWAMLIAVAIALYPQLQYYLFFQKNGFIRGSVIFAIQTCGDVSIPLILVILGANIANKDPPVMEESTTDPVRDEKWRFTQRQRGIILGVATRMIIVPVSLSLLYLSFPFRSVPSSISSPVPFLPSILLFLHSFALPSRCFPLYLPFFRLTCAADYLPLNDPRGPLGSQIPHGRPL
jgi:predicted permease